MTDFAARVEARTRELIAAAGGRLTDDILDQITHAAVPTLTVIADAAFTIRDPELEARDRLAEQLRRTHSREQHWLTKLDQARLHLDTVRHDRQLILDQLRALA